MESEIADQKRELLALKSLQATSGSKMKMYQVNSGSYTFTVSGSTFYGSRTVSYRMPSGYHYVTVGVTSITYSNASTGDSGDKSRIAYNCYQLPQNGNGTVQFRLEAMTEPRTLGDETITFTLTAIGDARGTFL